MGPPYSAAAQYMFSQYLFTQQVFNRFLRQDQKKRQLPKKNDTLSCPSGTKADKRRTIRQMRAACAVCRG
ncbi:hypothetical protein KL86DES1_10868 [uncultured Desulfovibrio sp.]|uniref:Uncharacterized protein n=1 Tax=uncultured Desulfovibrio sp. TaxID=167968 RepID=A0A212L0P6_9BACT|nr:hypothetical protein KL86DES1_10868 [uncultured Desulfovibrio sp.]VZH32741.1 conserved protein of unknown function [Desulfovibrio sp. 86]